MKEKMLEIALQRYMQERNGETVSTDDFGGSAAAYAWFVWEKGFNGETIIRWFN